MYCQNQDPRLSEGDQFPTRFKNHGYCAFFGMKKKSDFGRGHKAFDMLRNGFFEDIQVF